VVCGIATDPRQHQIGKESANGGYHCKSKGDLGGFAFETDSGAATGTTPCSCHSSATDEAGTAGGNADTAQVGVVRCTGGYRTACGDAIRGFVERAAG